MAKLISGGFVIGLMIFAVVMLNSAYLAGSGPFAAAQHEAAVTDAGRLNAAVAIASTSATPSGSATQVTVNASNAGGAYFKPSAMEVLVRYQNISDVLEAKRLTYVAGSPGTDQWAITALIPDDANPGVWDPGEVATVTLKVVPQAKAGTSGTVVLVTAEGIADSAYFAN